MYVLTSHKLWKRRMTVISTTSPSRSYLSWFFRRSSKTSNLKARPYLSLSSPPNNHRTARTLIRNKMILLPYLLNIDGWRSIAVANELVSINEVNLRWARLALGWVTVSGVQSPVQEIYQWSGSGGIQAWSQWPTGFLQCFDTVGLVIGPVKIFPEMTYYVLSGMLNPTHSLTLSNDHHSFKPFISYMTSKCFPAQTFEWHIRSLTNIFTQ